MANRIKLAMACAFLAAAQAAPAADADPGSILGFTPRDALREREIESQFQSLPSPEKAREWHRIFTSSRIRQHHGRTPVSQT